MSLYYLCIKEHEAAQGRQHKGPRKETADPRPFEDQGDISPEFCTAAKDINIWSENILGKKISWTPDTFKFEVCMLDR